MEIDVIIIAQYMRNIEELSSNNSRFLYLAHMLAKEYQVEIITSDFSHGIKKHVTKIGDSGAIKITVLHEPGYSKNVCLKRFASHKQLARNVFRYLNLRKKPDVVYAAVPSLDVAYAAASYCMKNKTRFIIDIQDLWPEAFKMVFSIPIISDIIFYPMKRQANYIYNRADEIIAVSQTYVDRGLESSKKCKKGYSIFLGTDLSYFDELAEVNKYTGKSKNEMWLAYIGTLGHSYDLISTIDALKILKDKGIDNIKFIIMGDGPLKSKFEKHVQDKGVHAEFTGRLDYGKMVGLLTTCDIAVNPISKGAAQSIINKHADYAAAGLPVINTQESTEYRNLVDNYKIGLNCINSDPEDMAEKLMILLDNKEMRKEMGKNSRKLAEEKFNRLKTYKKIIALINDL